MVDLNYIQQLSEEATERPWTGLTFTIVDEVRNEFALKPTDRKFIIALVNAYSQIRKELLAGRELARAWRDQTPHEVDDDAHFRERHAALEAYDDAIKETE